MTLGELYEKMPPGRLGGLLDVCESTDLTPRWPTTIRGWLSLAADSLLTDVLRRCVYRGCWRTGRYATLLSGRMCGPCYTAYYRDDA